MSLSPISWTAVVVAAATLLAPPARPAEPPAADPVQDFRAALLRPPGPGGANDRKADLLKRLDALDTVGRLAEALNLAYWAEERNAQPKTQQEMEAIQVDQEVHAALLKKFGEQVRKVLSGDDAEARAAAVAYVGTAAESARRAATGFNGPVFVRPGGPAAAGPFAELAPALIERTKDRDAAVRRSAVRALVEVRADSDKAADALGSLLNGDGKDKDPSVRRAASAALADLLAATAEEEARSLGLNPEAEAGFIRLEIRGVPLAAAGLGDDEAEVRRHCWAALRRAPDALTEPTAYTWQPPPPGFVPEQQQQAMLQAVRQKGRDLRSLADALDKALPDATSALNGDPEDAIAASAVLESAVEASRRLRSWEAALPTEKGAKPPPADPLPHLLDAREALAHNLAAKDVRVRLAALYALESFGPEAAPVSAVIAEALMKDADPFVRWGAARALGKMAPQKAEDAVPALAAALEDKNDDVRQTAPIALARFGPAAKPAVAALAAAVKRNDGIRREALNALTAAGPDAAPAADEAAAALDDADPAVRVAAAVALARMGPLGGGPRQALRRALDDPDAAVRGAAAAALLPGK